MSTGVISRTLARFDSDQPLSQKCTRASRASLGVLELQLLGRLILADDTLYLDPCVDYLAAATGKPRVSLATICRGLMTLGLNRK